MQPMKQINAEPTTLNQLKTRANKHGLTIRKYERNEDSYMLVDVSYNAIAAPAPMTLAQVELWLDDLDDLQSNTEENAE